MYLIRNRLCNFATDSEIKLFYLRVARNTVLLMLCSFLGLFCIQTKLTKLVCKTLSERRRTDLNIKSHIKHLGIASVWCMAKNFCHFIQSFSPTIYLIQCSSMIFHYTLLKINIMTLRHFQKHYSIVYNSNANYNLNCSIVIEDTDLRVWSCGGVSTFRKHCSLHF